MVYCFGEALIDLVMTEKNGYVFEANPGGAPANCAVAVAKLGGEAAFVGKVGNDRFGHMLKESLLDANVDCSHMILSDKFSTSLAIVSLDDKGDRGFEFRRGADAADLMLTCDDISDIRFSKNDTLYFGSCCLMSSPFREALSAAVREARRAGALICMDVNLRPSMWQSRQQMLRAMSDFICYADIVKMSDDEFELVTGKTEESAAAEYLLERSAEAVFITRGEKGAAVYLKDGRQFSYIPPEVTVCDTVGAGDAFTGAVLYSCGGRENELLEQNFEMMLAFAASAGTLSVTKRGGIAAMPTFAEVMRFASGKGN